MTVHRSEDGFASVVIFNKTSTVSMLDFSNKQLHILPKLTKYSNQTSLIWQNTATRLAELMKIWQVNVPNSNFDFLFNDFV